MLSTRSSPRTPRPKAWKWPRACVRSSTHRYEFSSPLTKVTASSKWLESDDSEGSRGATLILATLPQSVVRVTGIGSGLSIALPGDRERGPEERVRRAEAL